MTSNQPRSDKRADVFMLAAGYSLIAGAVCYLVLVRLSTPYRASHLITAWALLLTALGMLADAPRRPRWSLVGAGVTLIVARWLLFPP